MNVLPFHLIFTATNNKINNVMLHHWCGWCVIENYHEHTFVVFAVKMDERMYVI